ncbi:MAG TPA: hypothetical protein VNZ26_36225 [Vicinamibacterales bacterium]|nr:hypothetical protein [Vicinamibacterales bacterium]
MEIPVQVLAPDHGRSERLLEPVTVGVPLPRDVAVDASQWNLLSSAGDPMPLQVRVLERWHTGSIRWALVDTQVRFPAGVDRLRLRLCLDGRALIAEPSSPLTVVEEHGALVVRTGSRRFRLDRRSPTLVVEAVDGSATVFDGRQSELRIVAEGQHWPVAWDGLVVEEQGALRTVLRAHGEANGPAGRRLDLTARLHFHAGTSVVRLFLTVRNPARADHPDGIWELGDAGSILVRELTIALRLANDPTGPRLLASFTDDSWLPVSREMVSVYQESSGGPHWSSSNHVNREGRVPLRFRGYQARTDRQSHEGLRATPIVVVDRSEGAVGVAVPQFWQNFPRALSARPGTLEISFMPLEAPDAQELQGGEQKTHECYLLFGTDPVTTPPLEWCRSRLVARLEPDHYAWASAMPYMAPAEPATQSAYQSLVNAAIDGSDTFLDKRERVDEYGWRHFGDIYGDHEGVLSPDRTLVSHYNNQYDAIAGCACQFMRSADLRWWNLCCDLTSHVVDIDVYHTDRDKSSYNHGLFWHTVHYVDAGKSTHRTYPRATGSSGGGPASEQNYPTGLMLHYFMTGAAASRETAIELAQFVIDIDDGSKTIFSWFDRGYTGLASASRTPSYHGPGRGSGNSLNALVDGHRLTGDWRFLDKAEQIVRRCTHPRQDIEALDLLDAENRWFYTMYLQALGKYLDHKLEIGELNEMYAYARDVLLHFARWMASHEYPYLEKPDRLEYPTETWAAQDMRKSEVFDFAARHATGSERATFKERAAFFFGVSTGTLAGMPTRTLARPVVLLLRHGFMHEYLARHPDDQAPAPSRDVTWKRWPTPEAFVPQKARATRRAVAGAAVGGVAALMTLGYLAASLFK